MPEEAFVEADRRHESGEILFRNHSLTISGFTQKELIRATAWRYISDAITKEEALEMLKSKEAGKVSREMLVRRMGLVVRSCKITMKVNLAM
jgi:hypothetical protein